MYVSYKINNSSTSCKKMWRYFRKRTNAVNNIVYCPILCMIKHRYLNKFIFRLWDVDSKDWSRKINYNFLCLGWHPSLAFIHQHIWSNNGHRIQIHLRQNVQVCFFEVSSTCFEILRLLTLLTRIGHRYNVVNAFHRSHTTIFIG